MSYCRWSSDDFRCDVYAYESCYGGYEIHVASGRYKGEVPRVPPINEVSEDEWRNALKKQREYLDDCGTEPIGLPLDGESYTVHSPEELTSKLQEIKGAGYNVPDYVFERIEAEQES